MGLGDSFQVSLSKRLQVNSLNKSENTERLKNIKIFQYIDGEIHDKAAI